MAKTKRISPEEFVRAWQTSGSSREVASKLGMNLDAINQRVWIYRKHGIPLKRMLSVYKPRINYTKLKKFAQSLNGSGHE